MYVWGEDGTGTESVVGPERGWRVEGISTPDEGGLPGVGCPEVDIAGLSTTVVDVPSGLPLDEGRPTHVGGGWDA